MGVSMRGLADQGLELPHRQAERNEKSVVNKHLLSTYCEPTGTEAVITEKWEASSCSPRPC